MHNKGTVRLKSQRTEQALFPMSNRHLFCSNSEHKKQNGNQKLHFTQPGYKDYSIQGREFFSCAEASVTDSLCPTYVLFSQTCLLLHLELKLYFIIFINFYIQELLYIGKGQYSVYFCESQSPFYLHIHMTYFLWALKKAQLPAISD